MKDQEDTTQCERDDDRDIRSLMRDSDYSGRPRDEFKRDLLRELNHNFTYHSRRSRALVVAVVILAAGGVLWQAKDVGSDGFDLFPTGRKVNGGDILEAPMTGTRINTVPVEGDTDGGLAAAQEVYAQLMAGDAKLVGVQFWTFGGHTAQFVVQEVQFNGQPEQVMQSSGGPRDFRLRLRDLRKGPLKADLAAIEEGRLAPQRTESLRFRGRDFTMGVWTWNIPSDGLVTYKRSLPAAVR